MKNHLINNKPCFIFILLLLLFVNPDAHGQEKGDLRFNFAAGLGTKSGLDDEGDDKAQFGLTPGLEYLVVDNFSMNFSYDYFFKSSIDFLGSDLSARVSSVNIDAKYYLPLDGFQFYALFGVAIISVKAEFEDFEDSDSETGANIGVGAIFPISESAGIITQLKYQTPGEGQLVVNAGVALNLN